jgi:hypothetical protein
MFAGLQLCIALIVAPFLLMLAIGVACGTAFLAALLDVWNPAWWRLIKQHIGAMLRPTRTSCRAASPAMSTKSCTPPPVAAADQQSDAVVEKPLYEQLIDDERRRVRNVTEKLRARRRRAATLSHPPSAVNMGASLVAGLALSIDPPHHSLPVRRHRPGNSNLRTHKISALTPRDVDNRMYSKSTRSASTTITKESKTTHDDDFDRSDAAAASASYRDAAAELAALFREKHVTASPDNNSPLSSPIAVKKSTPIACGRLYASPSAASMHYALVPTPTMHSVDEQRRPERVGLSRMA